jgi:hypothetical protein
MAKTPPELNVVLSVRIPDRLRKGLSEKCDKENVSVVQFIKDCIEAYLDDRLRIIPTDPERPSYFDKPQN